MIPQSFIQDLLARVDIIDVIGQRLTLKKGGANYFACCPFHGEKTPSFSISPAKQFYHCFGCGVHGNAISFLMEYSGLSFTETVNELAQQLGLTVPQDSSAAYAPAQVQENDALLDAMTQAARFYKEQLKLSPAAVDYLKQRGLTGEVTARFGIGYAPDDWQGLAHLFPGYPTSKPLAQAGLVIDNEQGRRYDRFRNRIMFPIQDRRGRIIAFGGRVLGAGEPKYLNSPETPLFEKGRELYGLTLAQKAIREAGFALIVEGYMDVVALAQFGIENAVATLGTATTPHHIQLLLRQTNRIVFCFDGDAAGRKAAWRALESSIEMLRDDVTLAFLFLPEQHDPDSFVRTEGVDALLKAAATAMPLAEFLLSELSANCALDTAEGRARLAHDARPLVLRIAAPLLKLQVIKQIADASGLTQHEIETAYGLKMPPVRDARSASSRRYQTSHLSAARRKTTSLAGRLLRLVLHCPTWAARIPVDLVPDNDAEGLALIAIIDATSIGDIDHNCNLAALVERFRDTPHGTALATMATELVADSSFDESIIEIEFEDILQKLRVNAISHEVERLQVQAGQAKLSSAEQHRLNELIIEGGKLKSRT